MFDVEVNRTVKASASTLDEAIALAQDFYDPDEGVAVIAPDGHCAWSLDSEYVSEVKRLTDEMRNGGQSPQRGTRLSAMEAR
jgi:hypothetical protein